MLWPHRETAERQLAQQFADRALVQFNSKFLLDPLPQIDATPADHTVSRNQDLAPPIPPPWPLVRLKGEAAARCGAPGCTAGPAQRHCSDVPSPAASGDPWRKPPPQTLATSLPATARSPASAARLGRPASAPPPPAHQPLSGPSA